MGWRHNVNKVSIGLCAAMAWVGAVPAGEFYQVASMRAAQDWNEALWKGSSDATVAPEGGHLYINNLQGGRTRTGHKDNLIFSGDSLELRAEDAVLMLKGYPASVNLIMNAGTRVHSITKDVVLEGTITTRGAGAIEFMSGEGRCTTVSSTLSIGEETSAILINCGDGDPVNGPRGAGYCFKNAKNQFAGCWWVQKGHLAGGCTGALGVASFRVEADGLLDFDYDFSNETGTLTIEEGGTLDLDQQLSFASATIWGVKLSAGTYGIQELLNVGIDHAAFEDGRVSVGTITIFNTKKELKGKGVPLG